MNRTDLSTLLEATKDAYESDDLEKFKSIVEDFIPNMVNEIELLRNKTLLQDTQIMELQTEAENLRKELEL